MVEISVTKVVLANNPPTGTFKTSDAVLSLADKTIQYSLIVKKSQLKTEVSQAFDALRAALAKDKLGLQNVVKMEIGLSGLKERFAGFNPIYAAEFNGHAPTRVCVEPSSMQSEEAITLTATASSDRIEITKAGPAGAPYSAAVKAGDTLFVSGQIKPGEPDFGKQVDAVLGNIKAIASEAGAKLENAENVVVYSNVKITQDIQAKLEEVFGKDAKFETVETTALPAGVGFEVACNFRLS